MVPGSNKCILAMKIFHITAKQNVMNPSYFVFSTPVQWRPSLCFVYLQLIICKPCMQKHTKMTKLQRVKRFCRSRLVCNISTHHRRHLIFLPCNIRVPKLYPQGAPKYGCSVNFSLFDSFAFATKFPTISKIKQHTLLLFSVIVLLIRLHS